MNWLLVLSALFSTLTGVVTGVRPVEAAVQCSVNAATVRQNIATAILRLGGHAHLLGSFAPAIVSRLDALTYLIAATRPRFYLDRPRA